MKLKALRKFKKGRGNVGLEDIPEPNPGPNEVKIKIHYAGICGTDLHIQQDEYHYSPPVTLGHEFSGVIVEAGEDVKNFKLGDRVVAETNAEVCGDCEFCRAGRFCLCPQRKQFGAEKDGAFADFAIIRQQTLHKIPENVDMETAALSEPLSCIVHALFERSRILPEDIVVVIGPGAIGLMAVQVAKLMGAKVIVGGTSADKERLNIAKLIGGDFCVNIEKDDLLGIVNELTGGNGANVVLECSGATSAVEMGLDLLKKLGVFTQIGLSAKPLSLTFDKICFKEIDVFGSLSKTNFSWRKTLKLLSSKKIDVKPLITHIFSLDEWEKAFNMASEKKGLKILFKF
jgi:L-iditol 2-dehydrogenase